MRHRRRVRTWPTYLLHDVSDSLLDCLTQDARESDTSVADVIRAILCDRYDLNCPPVSHHYPAAQRPLPPEPTVLLRLQPKLHRALKRELAGHGVATFKDLILDTLETHYDLAVT